jgi:hypothetical protein
MHPNKALQHNPKRFQDVVMCIDFMKQIVDTF